MHRNRQTGRIAAIVSALTVLVTFGLFAGPGVAKADDTTLKVAIIAPIDSLNPFLTYRAAPINILHMQFEGLTEWDKDNKITGGFADKWETSPDGLTWTFHVPDGRQWSDGEPATAEDAAFTYTSIMTNEKLAGPNGSLVTNFKSATAKDKNTLVITLKEKQAANPGVNDIAIVPKHIWSKIDPATYADDGSKGAEVGSGPFVITKFAKDQYVELKANPKFWRGAPKVSGITWVYYKNTDAAVAGLKAGEIDLVAGLTSDQFNALKSAANIATANGAGRRYQGIDLNPGTTSVKNEAMGNGNAVLKDPQMRKALLMAIDNKTLLDKALGGLGKVGVTQQPTVFPDYFGLPSGMSERSFDIAGANKILDAAGYTKGSDGIRLDKQGKKISLRLMGRSTAPEHAVMAQYITGWMKQIGIEIKTQIVSGDQVSTDSTMGNYDMYFTGWGIGPDPDYQLSINTCASRPNKDGSGATSENNWCSPEFDAAYAKQHSELDPAKRADLVKQAWGILYQADVLDVLYYADSLEAWRSDRFTSDWVRQPSDGGVITGQSGYWGLYSATPVASASSSSSKGLSGLAWAGIGVGVMALAGIGLVLMRRGKKSDDKE